MSTSDSSINTPPSAAALNAALDVLFAELDGLRAEVAR